MKIVKSISEMSEYVSGMKRRGKSIGFVPTLGSLHKGHRSLMKKAGDDNDILVISIFVNPLQFKKKQFEEYPVDLEGDKNIAKEMGVDVIFHPSVEEVFPSVSPIDDLFEFQLAGPDGRQSNSFSFETFAKSGLKIIRVPENLCNKMDGKNFPWHFDGVATIVFKLFEIITPHKAYFGEKDIQQLTIIHRLVKDFNFDVIIESMPTVREIDGLAFSSRNSLLSSEQRKSALIIYSALKKGEGMVQNGEEGPMEILNEMEKIVRSGPLVSIEHIDVLESNTLETAKRIIGTIILYVSVKISEIRLTDCLIIDKSG